MKKMLVEAQADLESGIAKSLGRGRLNQAELAELEKVTVAELITDHSLDSVMAEKIMLHVQSEKYRATYQDQYVGAHVDDEFVSKGGYTRTHPIEESRSSAGKMSLINHYLKFKLFKKGRADIE